MKNLVSKASIDAVLHILPGIQSNRSNLYFHEEPSLSLRPNLEEQMDKIIFDKTLIDSFNINPTLFEDIKTNSKAMITSLQIDESGNEQQRFTEINRIIVYLRIFYFMLSYVCSIVLRGVLEE